MVQKRNEIIDTEIRILVLIELILNITIPENLPLNSSSHLPGVVA